MALSGVGRNPLPGLDILPVDGCGHVKAGPPDAGEVGKVTAAPGSIGPGAAVGLRSADYSVSVAVTVTETPAPSQSWLNTYLVPLGSVPDSSADPEAAEPISLQLAS